MPVLNPDEIPRLRQAHRRALVSGLSLTLGASLVVTGLAVLGILSPGRAPVEGVYQQAGFSFTGLVFLASAWMAWHRIRALKRFARLPASDQAAALLREARAFALAAVPSALWSGWYWSLVGWGAVRHVLTFLVLPPIMFLCFMPGLNAWTHVRKEVP
ncbi:MAG TPA: hypothetical protein VF768_00635 [Holophagaceae bacterium]